VVYHKVMILDESFFKKVLNEFFRKNSRPIDNGDLHTSTSQDISGDNVLRESDMILLAPFLAGKVRQENEAQSLDFISRIT
jgi:hypothetical protein